MSASRNSSLRILRAVLADSKTNVATRRSLHITGSQSSPAFSMTGATHTNASFNRFSVNDLKDECRRRTISSSGNKNELVDRLVQFDSLQSRAFSIAMRRIVKDKRGVFGAASSAENTPSRHFNTSRASKALNDSSTIDFAYLPDQSTLDLEDSPQRSARVPILPDAFDISSPASQAGEPGSQSSVNADAPVMKAEIYTVSDPDGQHHHLEESGGPKVSSMHEVADNHAMEIDPYDLTTKVSNAARKLGGAVENEVEGAASSLRTVWNGFVDDLLGEKNKSKLA